MTATAQPRWYLVQTRPRQEARAEENLQRQSFECYRPLIERGQGSSEPLFPGYLFIRLDHLQDNWYPIRSTRGVARIVAFGGQPTPVQDALIGELRERVERHARQRTPAAFKAGDRVQVSGDSFHDLEAIFVAPDGEQRSVILLNLLQRQQKVRVPNHFLHSSA
ncbi:MAG: transcription/translation regulatory transformer protein RfaH [Stutzerimonas sp.]|jgi:transcriptional antiterminator RfaH|uniref:transcription/translation regulatory transformer protein RfaH n=1 Tax=Stutzerimonas sp. TaxID=2901166 RepID=UPI003D10F1DB